MKEPRGCTHFRLRAFARRVGLHYDRALASVGLKTTQYSLLSNVMHRGPIGSAALAAAMSLTPSTLSRNLRPLIDAGYVELLEGTDARSHGVAITEAGRAKRAEAQRAWRGAQEALNRKLGTDTVAALHALIDEAMPRLEPATGETE
jgi:DNA-binding MarR family transcriptional regulator